MWSPGTHQDTRESDNLSDYWSYHRLKLAQDFMLDTVNSLMLYIM